MNLREPAKNILMVLSNWRYFFTAVGISFTFYAFNALLLNYRVVFSAFSVHGLGAFELYWRLIMGYYQTIAFHSFVTLLIISALFGLLFTLIVYKTLHFSDKKHPGFWGGVGIFLGVLAPGCAACGIGVFSLVGVSAATVSLLPFQGLELSFLAIIILAFSTFVFARDLTTCSL